MTVSRVVTTSGPEETEAFGEEMARTISPGDVILLEGDLAAGKTTLVRGLLTGWGGDPDDSSSPTFVVVQSYPCGPGGIATLHHVDLYRLPDEVDALREIGLEEYLADEHAVVVVEWPRSALADFIGPGIPVWRVVIVRNERNERRIEIIPPETLTED